MVVLLPKSKDGLDPWVRTLSPARLEAVLGSLSSQRIALQLPRFSFTTALDASALLKALGIAAAFDGKAADFTGISKEKPLFIGPVLHKAFVAVDESGTEAAAATVVMMRTGSAMRPQEPRPFVVDHPFLFVIRHRATGVVLFVGRVVDPTAS
jgi:serpin B